MLNNFFRINLPYGIARNEKGEWMAFNREYLPLGYNDTTDKHEMNSFGGKPVFTKYKRLTEKFLREIAWGPEGIQYDQNGEINRIFLYNDKLNPVNQSSDKKELWNSYFEKLKQLSKLERQLS